MASTTTPLLGLYKATPGTNEPFRASDINGNWDLLDTEISDYNDRITTFEEEADATIAEVDQALLDVEAAIASLDTAAIIAELNEGFTIDGGTA